MLHIKDETTATPQVNWEENTATCYCDQCLTEKPDFHVLRVHRFDGTNFTFDSRTFCTCRYVSVLPAKEDDPTAVILMKMLGLEDQMVPAVIVEPRKDIA